MPHTSCVVVKPNTHSINPRHWASSHRLPRVVPVLNVTRNSINNSIESDILLRRRNARQKRKKKYASRQLSTLSYSFKTTRHDEGNTADIIRWWFLSEKKMNAYCSVAENYCILRGETENPGPELSERPSCFDEAGLRAIGMGDWQLPRPIGDSV